MNRRKVIRLLLVGVMGTSAFLSGCGKTETEESGTETKSETIELDFWNVLQD